jgi:general nucleoside transport system ATP-binding protein
MSQLPEPGTNGAARGARPDAPAVEFRHVTKRFREILANDGIDLCVRRGTIHGLIGENGAGKSTAMNLLYGLHRPDAGEIRVHGELASWSSPAHAIGHGIGMVHQHFMLAGPYSPLDNIILGAEPGRYGQVDRRQARVQLDLLAEQFGLPVDWKTPVEELPLGLQQRVEILKLLYRKADILILDEPTAVLTPQETNDLFLNLRKLRDQGHTVLLVTHKLKEVLSLTDRVTVMRAGKVTGERVTTQTNAQELANLMVGRKVALTLEVHPAKPSQETAIELKSLELVAANRKRRLDGVSFAIRRGEIVGIAGVEGNGQSELLRAILDPAKPENRTAGAVNLLGTDVTAFRPGAIRDLGVALVPEDRLASGLLPERPLVENFLLGYHRAPAFNRFGYLRLGKVRQAAANCLERHDVRPRALDLPAGRLSGGNQQKLVLAREFQRDPQILIAAQPTRGVDVGAIEFIHRRIVQARDHGAGVLLISSDIDEILALSDRILVMYEGRIAAEFSRGSVSERELGLHMGGWAKQGAAP